MVLNDAVEKNSGDGRGRPARDDARRPTQATPRSWARAATLRPGSREAPVLSKYAQKSTDEPQGWAAPFRGMRARRAERQMHDAATHRRSRRPRLVDDSRRRRGDDADGPDRRRDRRETVSSVAGTSFEARRTSP
mmetsp:Transcript_35394/g.109625  ORF Transcript_35394/g.109625 Transcript_35394/m.109625 type:complete len:135 (-) Transcript_35394:197-601(-)